MQMGVVVGAGFQDVARGPPTSLLVSSIHAVGGWGSTCSLPSWHLRVWGDRTLAGILPTLECHRL